MSDYKASLLGRFLKRLPATRFPFYPLYEATLLGLDEHTVRSARLPAAFDGLRVAFLSDIHYGTYFEEDRVRALCEKVNALSPDLIILGGDYGENGAGALNFWKLRPGFKARYGVMAALGNHDRTPPESLLRRVTNQMRDQGVEPLVNRAVTLNRNGARLAVCSIDDIKNGDPDVEKVRRETRDADYVIFAPHNPDALHDIDAPFFDLALCGHTHGGQVRIFGYAPYPGTRCGYRPGWQREKGYDLLVSTGVGTSILPVRMGAKPLIHLITLARPCDTSAPAPHTCG